MAVALGALAAALTSDALAQSSAPSLFSPTLTDPRNTQRFGRAPDGTTRATQPAATPSAGANASANAGETGFDSTGSIAKKRKLKRKPGSPYPLPRAGAVVLQGPPQQARGHASAPQIAARATYANTYKPVDAPLRRPLPPNTDPFEPVGIRVGEFLFKPAIEAGYGVDTNPNRTPGGPKSNFTQVLPELQAKSEWSRHELGATLRGSYYAYNSLPSDNRPAADTKIFGRLDATRDLRFAGEGRFLLGTDNPGSPNLQAGLAKLPIFTVWGLSAGVAQRFNRLDLAVKGSVDRTEYANSELTDGSTVSNADRNFFQYRVQARVSYEFTPAVKPFVEMDVDQRKYGTPCTCDGIDRSSHAFTPRGGVTFELARHLTGEVSAGYTTRDYVSPDLQTLRGWVLDSSLIWVATGLTTVTLAASSRTEETVIAGVSGALRRECWPAGRSCVPPLAGRNREGRIRPRRVRRLRPRGQSHLARRDRDLQAQSRDLAEGRVPSGMAALHSAGRELRSQHLPGRGEAAAVKKARSCTHWVICDRPSSDQCPLCLQ